MTPLDMENFSGVCERSPRCCVCGVPTTWELLEDAGWVPIDELGWMCPQCQRRSRQNNPLRQDGHA